MKYSDLIQYINCVVASFNPSMMTPDSHFQEYLKQNPIIDQNQRTFIKLIYFGLQRYQKFLKASNQVLSAKNFSQIQLKKDWILLSTFTYILCFRLGQLPIKEYEKMVRSQNKNKMYILHYSLFDEQFVRKNLIPVWRDHLQESFIQKKIISYLEESKSKCWDLLLNLTNQQNKTNLMRGTEPGPNTLINQTCNSNQKKSNQKNQSHFYNFKGGSPIGSSKSQNRNNAPTAFQEFNLTKPKPKLIPTPQKISNTFKALSSPKKGKKLQQIIFQKSQRLQQIKSQVMSFYEQKKHQRFYLETQKRPSNFSKVKEQIKKKEFEQLQKKFISRSMPKYKQVEIRQNVANILREQKRIDQNLKQEQLKLKQLLMNLRDNTQYNLHQRQMQEADNYAAMQTRQKRKIEMQLARQAAMQAFQQKINEKKQLVSEMRSKSEKLKYERQMLNEQLTNNNKKVINEVIQMRQNVQLEMQKVIEINRSIHDQQKRKRNRIKMKKKQQDKVQLEKKRQLISLIRQFESNLKNIPRRIVEQPKSIGLMYQMSLQQLKSRLVQVKEQQKQQQKQRRNCNVMKQEQHRQSLNLKISRIHQYRHELSKQRSLELQRKKQQKQFQQERLNEAKIKSLNEFKKNEEKKMKIKQRQRQNMHKQVKQIELRNAFLAKDKTAFQKKIFQNVQKGQQRQILARQNEKLMNEYNCQLEKLADMKYFVDKNKKQVENKIAFNKLYSQRQQFDNRTALLLIQQDNVTKAIKYHETRTYEKEHIENMEKSNPYRKKAAQLSYKNALKLKSGLKNVSGSQLSNSLQKDTLNGNARKQQALQNPQTINNEGTVDQIVKNTRKLQKI